MPRVNAAQKRAAAARKGWATRRAKAAAAAKAEAEKAAKAAARRKASKKGRERAEGAELFPLLQRLIDLREQGASEAVIKRAHAAWYKRKLDVRDGLGERTYAKIVTRIGEALAIDDIQPYIDS